MEGVVTIMSAQLGCAETVPTVIMAVAATSEFDMDEIQYDTVAPLVAARRQETRR